MTGFIVALLTSAIGGLIGTYCGSRFLHMREENKMKNVRDIAIGALNVIKKYSKQSYRNAENDFNTSLSITEKRIIIVALHKLGIPIGIPSNEVFNIKKVYFVDRVIDKEEIDGIILQISKGYCDNLFYIDPDTYFAANYTLFAMRNVAKRYVKEVLANSKCDTKKKVWYPENWVLQFGVGEYLLLRILHEQLCVDYIYDKDGNAIPEKLEQVIKEIDMGMWDNSLQSNYEIYKNAKSQTEMNNAFQSLVSQQQIDGNNKASLDK
jgi:hypothetical protein